MIQHQLLKEPNSELIPDTELTTIPGLMEYFTTHYLLRKMKWEQMGKNAVTTSFILTCKFFKNHATIIFHPDYLNKEQRHSTKVVYHSQLKNTIKEMWDIALEYHRKGASGQPEIGTWIHHRKDRLYKPK